MYTDGGSRGNPGPAGAGVYITDEHGKELAHVGKSLGIMTNNEAEYEAVLLGLLTMKKKFGKDKVKNFDIQIRMDSELCVRQLTHKYQIKENRLIPYFIKIHNMRVSEFSGVSFMHIPREENKKADALANMVMDREIGFQ